MAKKKFGRFLALATITGVIAAGVSYFLKYKSFHDELDEEFHDFEGDDEEFDGQLPHASETSDRTYVTLNEIKEDASDLVKNGTAHVADTVGTAAQEMSAKAGEVLDSATAKAGEAIDSISSKADVALDSVSTQAKEMSHMVKDAVEESAGSMKKAVNTTATIEDDIQ